MSETLNTPNSEDIDALCEIVGDVHALVGDVTEPYCRDESPDLYAQPSLVLMPEDEREVSDILRYANDRALPIVTRGLGTGVAGGAVPLDGAIVLSLERMNKILEIDEDNLMVVTQPAVITGELRRAVEERGLFYPPDPASFDSCSIGGNYQTNAGGMTAVKYGITRDYVKGFRAVIPGGEIITYGGKLLKNVAGYDLTHIICGSEGTLAVATELTLKLLPLPACHVDLLVGFESVPESVEAVSEIIRRKIVPSTIEFMEGDIVRIVADVLQKDVPMRDAGAQLIISLDADSEEDLEKRYFALGEIAFELGAIDVLVADTRPFQDRIWEVRRSMREALRAVSPTIVAEDISVPRSKLAELWRGAREIGDSLGVRVLSFGHAGDGNLHIDALKDDIDDERWKALMDEFIPQLFKLAVNLGGSITAEHGIGYLKRSYLPIGVGEMELELMAGIKRAFDPKGILNPDKAI
ncbi:MAG TPA: FAD-binding protein [candidate division Zixibacteria bacterium]|nr:FAD-binding protein [candidate division Zixibacteria bacterium]